MSSSDTIAAIATPPGRGALAIVRISGDLVLEIAARLVARPLAPRMATFTRILDEAGGLLDEGLALYFPAPRTATGEDVLELHIHGSPVLAEAVLAAAFACGARLAGPGEFTRRGYLAGKLDLSAAESVADLIDAESRSAAKAAAARLAGGLATRVSAITGDLAMLLEELSGAIDFPDEVPDPDRTDTVARIRRADFELAEMLADSERGAIIREGASVAIIGPPNAGKSSLLNALLAEDRALVSDVAGTTRDSIEERLLIDGAAIRIIDTAGIRESDDAIERAGIERARRIASDARIVLIVIDGSVPLDRDARELLTATRERERVVFYNKADLGIRHDEIDAHLMVNAADGSGALDVTSASAATRFREVAEIDDISNVADIPDRSGTTAVNAARTSRAERILTGSTRRPADIHALRIELRNMLVGNSARVDLERPTLARAREIDAAHEARRSLELAIESLETGMPLDFLAIDLRSALAALGKICGSEVDENTLDGIFARFCIGK